MIETVRLFKQPPVKPGCELPEAKVWCSSLIPQREVKLYSGFTYLFVSLLLAQEYLEFQEGYRSSILASLGRRYHAIGPLLIKVEGLVMYTNTGKSHRLKNYYAYWEKRIFDALVTV